ncbi:ylmG homolog protein 2, chloroplastic-like [Macadamia integrifolia]|uniref:ylmG homolog protein 2, chloroplastic-like n=1 Tax=Macadamia integrifolia TaxID=60698 RepID=UPI001C501971|nr:ylmG homolog protein 2, chloroplastic-like [Macadamia integrifolia]
MAPDSPSDELATPRPIRSVKFVSNCFLFPAFLQTPFSPPPLSPSRPLISKPNHFSAIPDFIRVLRTSIFLTADRFYRTLSSAAAGNPIFQKLLSLSADFRHFSQVNCRNYRNSDSLSMHKFAAILPGDSIAEIVATNGILNFLNIYNTLLIVRLVLTWFPNSPPAIVSPLSTLCDPYLNIFRGIIPPLGGTLDLSPILAFLVLNAFTSAAAALPAELPIKQESHEGVSSSNPRFSNFTTTQKKWMKRCLAKPR